LGSRVCFPKSPEICVEILSPSNTEAEIREKMAPGADFLKRRRDLEVRGRALGVRGRALGVRGRDLQRALEVLERGHGVGIEARELQRRLALGRDPTRSLDAALLGAHVCTIPFIINEVTKATDPVKLYEYLSQGKPVVATPMRELQECSDLIYIAATAPEFASKLDAGLAEQGGELREARDVCPRSQRARRQAGHHSGGLSRRLRGQ
jgi:hypothetical protein